MPPDLSTLAFLPSSGEGLGEHGRAGPPACLSGTGKAGPRGLWIMLELNTTA